MIKVFNGNDVQIGEVRSIHEVDLLLSVNGLTRDNVRLDVGEDINKHDFCFHCWSENAISYDMQQQLELCIYCGNEA